MAEPTPAVDLPTPEETKLKIKVEKDDDKEITKEKNPREINNFIVNDPQLSGLQSRNITITVSAQRAEKAQSATKHKQPLEKQSTSKSEPLPIDHPSACGKFGWSVFGPIHLPILLRGEEKVIAVRMFETKIVFGYFPDIFPTAVFSCTNIISYYVTESEAKLLNEINSFHCDYQFGYNDFCTKDYVVLLKDALQLFEFLEFCRLKLYGQNSNTAISDKCGFLLNYKIPFVKKGTKKYVSLKTLYPEGVAPPVTSTETVTHWDIAYFRFLSCFGTVDLQNIEVNTSLCNIEDLETALGSGHFPEVATWPEMQFSSKQEWEQYLHSRTLQWLSDSTKQPPSESMYDPKRLRKRLHDMPEKESVLNSILGFEKYLDMPRSNSARSHEQTNGLNLMQGSDKTGLFPVSLENFLATSSSCNYAYPVSYNHYNSHIQTPQVLEYERYRKAEGGMPTFSPRKSRTYPPPPPLVRLGSPRSSSASSDSMMPKTSSLYPYLPPPSNAPCPPWLARILEPDWLEEEGRAPEESPENLSSRRVGEGWCPVQMPPLNGTSASDARSMNYDLSSHATRDPHHGGSPRLLGGPGPPPHYPTPPQSSPLQPMALLDAMPGFAEMYATRLTPNGLQVAGLCSPPPSPETRSVSYQPHVTRLVQVESRHLPAINVEPLKYNSHLAVPLSDVVNKFLRGTTVQSCQMMLESMFGIHLYECTSLQQEAFARHNFPVSAGGRLVLLSDLKACLHQLRYLSAERAEQFAPKRWCANPGDC